MSRLFVAEPQSFYRRLPPIVVDCSVLAAILFGERERDNAEKALENKSLFAPWLIDLEMVNVALKKAKSGLGDVAGQGMEAYGQTRINRRAIDSHAQWLLAKQENLSAYDAAYLQLAVEMNTPLVTYDQKLNSAAERVLGRLS